MRAGKKDINILIGMRLQNARVNGGYSMDEFADTLNLSTEHYRKIESGTYGLHPEKMLLLYQTYKIDPAYLISGDRRCSFQLESFLANCSTEERDEFLEHVLLYMKKLMIQSD